MILPVVSCFKNCTSYVCSNISISNNAVYSTKINHKNVLQTLYSSYNASLLNSSASKRLIEGVTGACVTEPLS